MLEVLFEFLLQLLWQRLTNYWNLQQQELENGCQQSLPQKMLKETLPLKSLNVESTSKEKNCT